MEKQIYSVGIDLAVASDDCVSETIVGAMPEDGSTFIQENTISKVNIDKNTGTDRKSDN